jgi:hypothetical protein
VPVEEVPPNTAVGFNVTVLSDTFVTVRVAVWPAPYVPEIVTVAFDVTALVVTVNVAVLALAGTVTLAGTCAAAVLLLASVTTAPPVGAGPVRVTVPIDVPPPGIDVGFTPTELRSGRFTVKAAVLVAPYVAEMVTDALALTGLVVMVNVAIVWFAATVTLVGTCAAAVLLLDNVTTAPPAGAGAFNVTVPVAVLPPVTDVGLTPREFSAAAVTVKVALCVALYVAEILSDVVVPTGFVVTVNVAIVWFAATVMLAGT